MSYLTQMLGLTVQNFLSAATGMAILVALVRGFVRHSAKTIGNFWVDMTRSVLYILLTAIVNPGASSGFTGRGADISRLPGSGTLTADTGCQRPDCQPAGTGSWPSGFPGGHQATRD